MTNPLTAREAPDPMTLTGFSKRSQSEIDHNLFAAKTGGLVAISAPSFWEMYYAAQAWHAHLASPQADAVAAETERCARICDGWAATQIDGAVASMCAHDIRGLSDVPGSLKPSTAMERVAALEAILRELRDTTPSEAKES